MKLLYVVWDFDPVFINIAGLEIVYYGLMWVVAFVIGGYLFTRMVKREGLNPELSNSAFNYGFLSIIIGARLGHCLFYDFQEFFLDPFMDGFPWIKILHFRGGGLASHGAAIGLLIGIWLFSRKWKTPYIWFLDRIGIIVTIAGAIIRIGNLLNSEVYGTATDLPWGFIFVRAGETVPMHPTQIYEALAYLILFAVLAHMYWRTNISNRRGVMFGVFLIGLFLSRFIIETIKAPQSMFEVGMTLNMGQWLSVPFVIAGIVILVIALRRAPQPYTNMPVASSPTRAERRHGKK